MDGVADDALLINNDGEWETFGANPRHHILRLDEGITGSVLLIIFKSLISLCFITCLIRISLNLKNDQKNRPHDPACRKPAMGTGTWGMRDKFKFTRKIWKYE